MNGAMWEALALGLGCVLVSVLAVIAWDAYWYAPRRRVWKRDASWAAVKRRVVR